MSTTDSLWPGFGVSLEEVEKQADWLARDHHNFPGTLVNFFRSAADCLRLTNQNFSLLPLVFSQTVIGLEKVLRVYSRDSEGELKLADMLKTVVQTKIVTDKTFPSHHQWPKYFRDHLPMAKSGSYAEKIAILIPRVRNTYMHGNYFSDHNLLNLAIHARSIVDAVTPHLPSTWPFVEPRPLTAPASDSAQSGP